MTFDRKIFHTVGARGNSCVRWSMTAAAVLRGMKLCRVVNVSVVMTGTRGQCGDGVLSLLSVDVLSESISGRILH